MPTISDVSIIDSNTAEAKKVKSGLERVICSESLCGAKNLTVYRRTISKGRQFPVDAGKDYHLIYVMQGSADGVVSFNKKTHAAEKGAGVLLAPGESARFDAVKSDLELLHMVAGRPGLLLQSADVARLERRERRPRAPFLRRVQREAHRR